MERGVTVLDPMLDRPTGLPAKCRRRPLAWRVEVTDTMTAEPHGPTNAPPFLPAPDKTPRAIRAALLPEEVGDFDREFRAVMAEATETLDLTVVTSFLERWWRVAWSSTDASGHRAMLERADELTRGEDVPTRPWAEVRERLGL
ncbi:hypothetical protein GCM10014719_58460 [Planomonospora parontospora subsp. antibiotica]|nr:hypothetical protein GCM10014719_58460 [Planomonospora parontospora subsp. antibiotica]GII15177.1 hypothetical protein Ppa05_19030 [Planomonospora parontospora subsp. antibiotica]